MGIKGLNKARIHMIKFEHFITQIFTDANRAIVLRFRSEAKGGGGVPIPWANSEGFCLPPPLGIEKNFDFFSYMICCKPFNWLSLH